MTHTFLTGDGLNLQILHHLTQPPPLFEDATAAFWKDPHIAQQMLTVHLDPNHDAASRAPQTIQNTVDWLANRLPPKDGDSLLDLGCGPGLYCRRFAEKGWHVTGVDFSQNSITYARQNDPATTYLCQDYLTLDFPPQFDVVTQIYGDFCVFSDSQRDQFLRVVHRALKPGGHFVFDVTTWAHHRARSSGTAWEVYPAGGFWKPGPHLVLEQCFHYPDSDVTLEQYLVVEESGVLHCYRNWFHYYSPQTLTPVLEQHGFVVLETYSDLAGAPCTPESEWVGVIAQKR